MYVYIPAHYEEEDYTPSWTGNFCYPTMTIRGIFDSLEKAEKSIKNWKYKNDCMILERWIDEDYFGDIGSLTFDIRLKEDYLYIDMVQKNNGEYAMNKIVDEAYSVCYDENNHLGVDDY